MAGIDWVNGVVGGALVVGPVIGFILSLGALGVPPLLVVAGICCRQIYCEQTA